MHYELHYTLSAEEELDALDKEVELRIVRKMKEYLASGTPMRFAKPLAGEYAGYYRFRVGDFRVIFSKEKDGIICILLVLRVGHRRDIYI